MTTALILAGGLDIRFQLNIPKQFVNVDNRPLIIYTLEQFQQSSDVDEIIVMCLEGWQEMVRVYVKQFNLSKVNTILEGGKNVQESTYLGLQYIKKNAKPGDIVIIHDAIRPLVTEDIISKSIQMCRKKGMGVAATPILDTIIHSVNQQEGYHSIKRDEIMKVQTPQTFDLEYLWKMHEKALAEGRTGAWDNCSLLTELGEKVIFSEGSDLNLRINTTEDVEMFQALYKKFQNKD